MHPVTFQCCIVPLTFSILSNLYCHCSTGEAGSRTFLARSQRTKRTIFRIMNSHMQSPLQLPYEPYSDTCGGMCLLPLVFFPSSNKFQMDDRTRMCTPRCWYAGKVGDFPAGRRCATRPGNAASMAWIMDSCGSPPAESEPTHMGQQTATPPPHPFPLGRRRASCRPGWGASVTVFR